MIRTLSLLAVMSVAAPVVAQTADPAPVIAAERAFAADGLATGVDASFLKWSAPEAVMIAGGGPKIAHEILDPHAVFDPAAPSLVWWPNWAGIAMSGDLGFTTGGVEVGGRRTGHYFTIWKRQPDGDWKWVYDGGTGATAANVPGAGSEPMRLAVSTTGSASPEAAMTEVRAAEATLAAAAATDQKAAHLAVLADDGRLYVAPLPPAIGARAYAAALDAWPATFRFEAPTGGGASQAGDLVWDYGAAGWSRDGAARTRWYVHLWQKRPEGWRLAFAQLLPNPPPATPAPSPAS
jgi:ketosteroid isomerase-like protein